MANYGSFAAYSHLNPAQCTGIVGRNGVGKTTPAAHLPRRTPRRTKARSRCRQVAFNYIDQARMQLNGTGTVLEEISDGNETGALWRTAAGSARSYLRRFLFSDERVNEPVARLRGAPG